MRLSPLIVLLLLTLALGPLATPADASGRHHARRYRKYPTCHSKCSRHTRLHNRWCHPRHCRLAPCGWARGRRAYRCVARRGRGHSRRSAAAAITQKKHKKSRGRGKYAKRAPQPRKRFAADRCARHCVRGWRAASARCDRRYCAIARCGGRWRWRSRQYFACMPAHPRSGSHGNHKRTNRSQKGRHYGQNKKGTRAHSKRARGMSRAQCENKCFYKHAWAARGCDAAHCAVAPCRHPARGFRCAPRAEAHAPASASGGAAVVYARGARPSPSPYPLCVEICGKAAEVRKACCPKTCRTVACSDRWFTNGLKCVSK